MDTFIQSALPRLDQVFPSPPPIHQTTIDVTKWKRHHFYMIFKLFSKFLGPFFPNLKAHGVFESRALLLHRSDGHRERQAPAGAPRWVWQANPSSESILGRPFTHTHTHTHTPTSEVHTAASPKGWPWDVLFLGIIGVFDIPRLSLRNKHRGPGLKRGCYNS